MINRRKIVKIAASIPSVLVFGGCATPLPPAQAPYFQWGQLVDFESISFEFNSARVASFFTNWLNQRTIAADTFVIVEVTVINRTGAPLPLHFQPIFRLRDSTGAIYEPDTQKTMMINMHRPGRVPFGQSMNPNTKLKQEIVFTVPKQDYSIQVILPSRARVGFGGGITSSGPYFLYDISSQL